MHTKLEQQIFVRIGTWFKRMLHVDFDHSNITDTFVLVETDILGPYFIGDPSNYLDYRQSCIFEFS
jgi:hypothetical protein